MVSSALLNVEREPSEPVLHGHRRCDGSLLPESEVGPALRTHQLLPHHQPRGQVTQMYTLLTGGV